MSAEAGRRRGGGRKSAGGDTERRAREPEPDRVGDDRKERVLHTRISDQLAEDIHRVAEDLRIPVSNLVRNVLQDVFSVMETVTDNVGGLIEDVIGQADRTREQLRRRADRLKQQRGQSASSSVSDGPRETDSAPPEDGEFGDILAWQPLILNQRRTCAACSGPLKRGDHAVVGLTAAGLSASYLCMPCMQARS